MYSGTTDYERNGSGSASVGIAAVALRTDALCGSALPFCLRAATAPALQALLLPVSAGSAHDRAYETTRISEMKYRSCNLGVGG
jgi:hypothetical protein